MNPSRPGTATTPDRGSSLPQGKTARWWLALLAGSALAGGAAWWYFGSKAGSESTPADRVATQPRADSGTLVAGVPTAEQVVRLTEEQQRAIGLRTDRVVYGDSSHVTTAPGRVVPDENQYAFITPRAAGVVRSVTAHLGQEVKAGDLLATIDSPVVGEARLDLYTKLQALDIALSQAEREAMIYANTLELLALLKKEETPEQVHNALQDRAVGANRERLMTAYAQYRLAKAALHRNRDLISQKLIAHKDFEQVNATYEEAQATYQSLLDEMGYEVRLENTRAQQARKQAEAAVRAARERLKILGVKSDGTEPPIEDGRVVGVARDGTIAAPAPSSGLAPEPIAPETILPPRDGSGARAVPAPGTRTGVDPDLAETPVSTYSIWAPFDGTILDREMIVPGVAVDTTHRIFTLANLAAVWIEANVREGDFARLDRIRSGGGTVKFRSQAYPGRVFEGEMIYSGDLVDEQSRSVKLLARAENPDRLLRPGMFVEVEVLSPRAKEVAQIPTSALLTDGDKHYVYVKTGSERFARKDVDAEAPRGDEVTIRSGLEPGEDVVVEGGYKLKAMAVRLASIDPGS